MARKENPDRARVQLRMSNKELALIDAKAKAVGRDRNIYIREMAAHGKVVKFDYKYFDENNRYMKEVKNDIRLLIYTILQTNEYFSIDLENINNSLQKIIENQGLILKEFRKEGRNLRKILNERLEDIEVEKSDY